MSFYDWCLKKYTGKQNPEGDLAGDISRDLEFPKTSTDKSTIENHLQSRYACDDAVQTFRDVYCIYQTEVCNERTAD